MASLAELDSQISFNLGRFEILVAGFSDKLLDLLVFVFKKLVELKIDENRLRIIQGFAFGIYWVYINLSV